MNEEKPTLTPTPNQKPQLGEAGEHPLSVLLFSWMRSKLAFRIFMAVLAALGAVLIGLEVVFSHRPVTSIVTVPGFFGIFGFVAFAIAVLSGWPLGKLLRRPEDYYETRSGEAGRDR